MLQTPNAFRRVGLIQGGSFEGERLSGEVVSGNDWRAVHTDSSIRLDVNLILKTTDGALIVMTYQCLRTGPARVIEKLDQGPDRRPPQLLFQDEFHVRDQRPEVRLDEPDHRDRPDGPICSIFEVL